MQSIARGARRDGWPAIMPDLTARAMSLHNKSRAGAQKYLRRHAILANPPFYDPGETR